MTAPSDPMLVMITRVEGKLDTLAERVQSQGKQHTMSDAQLQRAMDSLRESIKEAREEARRETTGATARLTEQIQANSDDLTEHEASVNPHPEQERWLRENMAILAASITTNTEQIALAVGAGKVLSSLFGLGGGIAAGVATALIVKASS